jgi:hypothetical protein
MLTCFAAAGTISDLSFAIVPTFFVWRLQRARLERILVSVLMSIGLCATAVMLVRLCEGVAQYGKPRGDDIQTMAVTYLYCRLEECFLVTAACAPFLKAPVERVLKRLGFAPNFGNRVAKLNSISLGHHNDSQPLGSDDHRRADGWRLNEAVQPKGEYTGSKASSQVTQQSSVDVWITFQTSLTLLFFHCCFLEMMKSVLFNAFKKYVQESESFFVFIHFYSLLLI